MNSFSNSQIFSFYHYLINQLKKGFDDSQPLLDMICVNNLLKMDEDSRRNLKLLLESTFQMLFFNHALILANGIKEFSISSATQVGNNDSMIDEHSMSTTSSSLHDIQNDEEILIEQQPQPFISNFDLATNEMSAMGSQSEENPQNYSPNDNKQINLNRIASNNFFNEFLLRDEFLLKILKSKSFGPEDLSNKCKIRDSDLSLNSNGNVANSGHPEQSIFPMEEMSDRSQLIANCETKNTDENKHNLSQVDNVSKIHLAPSSTTPFICHKCGKYYKIKTAFIKHMKEMHTILCGKSFFCKWQNCNFGSHARGQVTRHVRSVHLKNHRCAESLLQQPPQDFIGTSTEIVDLSSTNKMAK